MQRKDSKEIKKCYKIEIKIHSNKIIFLNCIIVYYYLSYYYYSERIMSVEYCSGFLFWQSLLLVALNLARNKASVVSRISYSLRWCVGVFSTFKECFKISGITEGVCFLFCVIFSKVFHMKINGAPTLTLLLKPLL